MADKNFKVKNGADIGGTVTATAFVGDGSGLTGISSYLAPTLGSTSVASGATVTTIAGLTLTSPTLTTPALGTPASGTLTNATGLPVATGISGLGTGVATFLATPSSTNLRGALTDETGSGAAVFGTSPTISGLTLTGTLTAGGGVGTNGQVLQSTATGVQWATPAGGGSAATATSLGTVYGSTLTGSSSNLALGYNAASNQSNVGAVAIGVGAKANGYTTPISIGLNAGAGTTLNSAISIGANAGFNNTSSGGYIAIGHGAGQQANGTDSAILIGSSAGYGLTNGAYQQVFIGNGAGANSAHTAAIGIGINALQPLWPNTSTPSGDQNIAIGTRAGCSITTGSNNIMIGKSAGFTNDEYASVFGTSTGDNNIIFGTDARASSPTVSNQITLGNSSMTSLRCQVTSISGLSDERDKTNIEDLPIGIDFVKSLRPVKFEWNMRDEGKVGIEDFGFIAQEVMESEDSIDGHEWLGLSLRDNEDKYEVAPAKLVPILVKAIQDLSKEIQDLKNNNNLS